MAVISLSDFQSFGLEHETYEGAKARIKRASDFHFMIVSPIFYLIFFPLIFGIVFGSDVAFEMMDRFFFFFWLFIAITMSHFIWRTRDIFFIVSKKNSPLRLLLGSDPKLDPFLLAGDNLPNYLKCQKCNAPLLWQGRILWNFRSQCEGCGATAPNSGIQ